MPNWLKLSTAVDIGFGPFLDETDGKTAETGLTITQPDIRLKKNGGAWAQKNAAQTLNHEEAGWYEISLDATDTNTLGILIVAVHESGALPVWREFMVVPANIYDSIVGGTDLIDVSLAQIDGSATNGNNATLNLKQLNIQNATGDAIVASSTGSNGKGINASGNGSGAGIIATGGATGHGLSAVGGSGSGDGISAAAATSGHGITATGVGTTKHGINATGGATTSHGISATGGGVGHGILATSGGGSTGDGIRATAASSNGNGINGIGVGTGAGALATGGATGHGISAVGGATSGDGISAVATTSGHGLTATGVGTTRHGINATGGATASSGISAAGGGIGAGIRAAGGGTGVGFNIIGGGTSGVGLNISTTSGDGIAVAPTAGHGLNLTANGTSKHGLFATGGTAGTSDGVSAVAGTGGVPIRGNITGNLSGSIGSVATGGIAAASFAAGAIDATAIATGAIDADAIADNAIDAGAIASDAITAAKIATGAITSAKFAAGAIDAAAIATDAIGSAEFAQAAADKIWLSAARTLTAGTNIVLAKGVGITGFNDLSAAQVNAEADTALADVGVTTTVTGRIDVAVSTRLASASYTAPDNANIAAIVADTNELQTDWANGGRLDLILDARASQASVDTIDGIVDAIKIQTDNLPSDPADQSLIIAATDAIATLINGLNDLSAADIRDAIGLATANLDTQLDALPTANENRDAVFARAFSAAYGSYTFDQMTKLIASVLLAKVSGMDTFAPTFRNLNDSANVVTAVTDASGNRPSVTLNP